MKVAEVREKFLKFMESKGHKIVPSASLVPENDPTTLFTGSGMQPMVPYLLGADHPMGTRIADSQRCFRAEDIDEVGDNRHTTFFEMLGNWSFGDYFKTEQIEWLAHFLFNELGIDPSKIFITCFGGDKEYGLPKDVEAYEIWKARGVSEDHIYFYGGEKNWWSRGGAPKTTPIGDPCGPDSEVFYEFDIPHDPKFGDKCHPNCDCGRYMEIGNSVFMQYKKVAQGKFEFLPRQNVDFGGGLERITAAANNCVDIFKLDIFAKFLERLEKISGKNYSDEKYTKSFRVIMDHVRASHALIEDGVRPSNTEQGYMLRRFLRRAVVHADKLNIPAGNLFEDEICNQEEEKFRTTLDKGLREFEKGERDAFKLFTTYGFPFELTKELANERGEQISETEFKTKMAEHSDLSRAGSEQKFKGGLADTSEMTVKYHTATHLLHKALKQVLGKHVNQKGSNITPERLRFDFSHTNKMTDDEKTSVEALVNEQIAKALPMRYEDLSYEEAKKRGAVGLFEDKYGETVRVYQIGDRENTYSIELCGGPHVMNTSELGEGGKLFRILKEEAVASGIRRIKAVLE